MFVTDSIHHRLQRRVEYFHQRQHQYAGNQQGFFDTALAEVKAQWHHQQAKPDLLAKRLFVTISRSQALPGIKRCLEDSGQSAVAAVSHDQFRNDRGGSANCIGAIGLSTQYAISNSPFREQNRAAISIGKVGIYSSSAIASEYAPASSKSSISSGSSMAILYIQPSP